MMGQLGKREDTGGVEAGRFYEELGSAKVEPMGPNLILLGKVLARCTIHKVLERRRTSR